VNLVFSSKVPKQCRVALEKMLFFNPRQHRVREGIVNSLEQFGHPRLEDTADGLSVRVGDRDAQTLFAYDRDRRDGNPVGVVVFLRTSPPEITILHVAVHPNYTLQECHAGMGVGVTLVEKVKEIASRIVGVQRVGFFYRREVVLRI
jgi:ribosomal protein S18 acetylase RimI-like enzyme